MIDLLRFLGGLVSAALLWLAGLLCTSPTFFILAFDESGRLSRHPDPLLVGFLLLGCVVVWIGSAVVCWLAPGLSQSEPFGYGQTTIGAILCMWGVAESRRAALMDFASIYPLLSLCIPGLVLLLYGFRVLMMVYIAGE